MRPKIPNICAFLLLVVCVMYYFAFCRHVWYVSSGAQRLLVKNQNGVQSICVYVPRQTHSASHTLTHTHTQAHARAHINNTYVPQYVQTRARAHIHTYTEMCCVCHQQFNYNVKINTMYKVWGGNI